MTSNLPVLELSPSWNASVSIKLEYGESELGDRYISRVGTTHVPNRIWTLRKVTNTTERDSIINQLKLYSETVQPFLWSPHPDFLRLGFFCETFSETQIGPDAWEIQAVFTQDITSETENFGDLIDDTVIDNTLAGTLTWLQTYTRDTLPLAANSDYVTVNSFHNVLGRGGYFPGSAGTTEGQAALGRACMEAFLQTNDTQWRDYALNIGNSLIDNYYNDPIPSAGNEFNTLWLCHWLINVKESFVSRGPQDSTDPLNYGDFGREITFTNGEGFIPTGNPANGELVAVVYKVYSTDGTLLWNNVNTPLVAGTEYPVNYFVSDFQLKGQNFRIFADTESSGGTPPVQTSEAAGKIVLTSNYTGQAKLIYSTYTGPTISVNELFEPYPMWRELLPGELQFAFDVGIWSWQFYQYLFQETGDDKWRRAAEATKYSVVQSAVVENLSYYYQISDDPDNLYTYPGSQVIQVQNVNGFTDSRQIGGDKDQWVRLDVNAAPPLATEPDGSLTLGPDGEPIGPFPSIEIQNFAIVTGVLATTTVEVNAAHSGGGQIEIGLSIDDDPFTFDQIYKQFWKLNASGLPTNRIFNAGEFILWNGDYLTWFYAIAEDPIFTYQGGSGTATTDSAYETFTYNGITAEWLIGTLTLNGDGGFAGGGLVWLNLGAFTNAPPKIWLKHSGAEIHYKVIDGDGNDYFFDIADTGGLWVVVEPTWDQMYQIGDDNTPNRTDSLQSIEFVAKGTNGTSTTSIWYATPLESPRQLDLPTFTYKAVATSRQRSAHTLWIGDFRPIGNTLDELLYNPGVVPFTVNLLNGVISDWRGIPYAGYQSPYKWQQWGYPTRLAQVEDFLLAAQASWSTAVPGSNFGPFAPVFSWSYWDNGDFLENGLNDFGWNGPDPNTNWAPYSYRVLESAAHTWVGDPTNIKLSQIVMQFLRYLDDDFITRGSITPITDFPENAEGQANYAEPHSAALIGRSALYANLAGGDPAVTFRLIKICYDYVLTQYIDSGPMLGAFAADQPDYTEGATTYKEYFIFWHAEIIEFLALIKKHKPDFNYPGPETFLL